MHSDSQNIHGFGIIEIIVAMSLFLILAVSGTIAVVGSFSTNRLGDEQTAASLYAQQGIEVARSIRNQGWLTQFMGTPCSGGCGASLIGGSWAWSGSSNVSGKFTRVIRVSSVNRSGGSIVSGTGTSDADTKKVTSSVSWNFTPTRNDGISFVTYLTNYTKTRIGNWALPSLEGVFNLTVANSGSNNANATSIAYSDPYVYVGRRSSGGTELVAINISDRTAPSLCATCQRELGDSTNDILINGSYAYIASANNAQELQIINISSPTILSTASLTTFDLTAGNSGNANADGVALALSGTNVFMIRNGGNEFIRFDISLPASPSLSATGSGFTGVPSDMVISGSYAFVTSDDNAAELQVMNLSTLARSALLNLNSGNNNANAMSITAVGNNRLLVGRQASAAPELYTIAIDNPLAPSVVSTLEIGSDVVKITYGNSLIFLATSDNTNDVKIINGSSIDALPALPAFGLFNSNVLPLDEVYIPSLDRLCIVASNNSAELEIIKPQ